MEQKKTVLLVSSRRIATAVAVLVVMLMAVSSAVAFELTLSDEVTGSLNTTLSYGVSARTEDAKVDALSPNTLGENYWSDKGDIFSNVFKVAAELKIDYRNYGLVSNASYTYDAEIMNADSDIHAFNHFLNGPSKNFTNDTEDVSGSSFELLDAYAFGTFEPAEKPLEIRVGKQVINWGEGLYFVDGVSTQVPFNLAKLVLPGSETKDAFIGLGGVRAMLSATDSLSLDAYYLYEWQEHLLSGTGTFYGDDVFGPGTPESWKGSGGLLDPSLSGVDFKGENIEADDDGQFGLSARYLVGDWELGLYYSRHHEFFPQIATNTSAQVSEIFHEDVDMYGASFSTSLGMWSVNGEIAYRPGRLLATNVNEAFANLGTDYVMGEKHDYLHGSVHGLGLYGGGVAGIDSNFYLVQLGWENIQGNTDNLQANGVITRSDQNKLGLFETADSNAFGIAAEWDATWQAVMDGVDVTSALFVQYDFSGNSQLWGNFAEGRVLSSLGLTAAIGTAWETSLNYSRWDQTESHYADQDSINFAVNYKF